MADFYDLFFLLQDTGFYELVLPFILVFAITYGVLHKVNLFRKNPGINSIIAIIMGLLVVSQFQIVDRLNLFIPKVGFLLVIILMFLFLIGIFQKGDYEGFTGVAYFIAVIISILLIIWALGPSLGLSLYEIIPIELQSSGGLILGLLVLGVAIWMISAGGTTPRGKSRSAFDNLIDELGGKRNP